MTRFQVFSMGILLVLVGGCAHRPVALNPATVKEKSFYEEGQKAIIQKDFKTAVQKFGELLQEFPTSRWLVGAYYNLGAAYEGLGDFANAAINYKKVVEFYDGLKTRDEAEALYRYSICQEYLGDDDKMLMALLQLQDRGFYLTKEQAEVEVPARTAAAYARLDNLNEATRYFTSSEAALKKLLRIHKTPGPNGENDLQSWLPKTLYSVGRIPPHPHDKTDLHFKSYLASLEQSQERLLRAAETGQSDWAKKASAELIAAYNEAWDWIENVEVPASKDQLQFAKQRQERQRGMAADFDVTIDHLKLSRMPSTVKEPEPPQVTEIFKTAANIQRKLSLLIDAPDIQDQDTPESQKQNALKRAGKILNQK